MILHWQRCMCGRRRPSLVVQTIKNPPTVRETWVRSLGWEDILEEGMATHSSTLAWRIPMVRGGWWATVHGLQRVRHDWATKHTQHIGQGRGHQRKRKQRLRVKSRPSMFFLHPNLANQHPNIYNTKRDEDSVAWSVEIPYGYSKNGRIEYLNMY